MCDTTVVLRRKRQVTIDAMAYQCHHISCWLDIFHAATGSLCLKQMVTRGWLRAVVSSRMRLYFPIDPNLFIFSSMSPARRNVVTLLAVDIEAVTNLALVLCRLLEEGAKNWRWSATCTCALTVDWIKLLGVYLRLFLSNHVFSSPTYVFCQFSIDSLHRARFQIFYIIFWLVCFYGLTASVNKY